MLNDPTQSEQIHGQAAARAAALEQLSNSPGWRIYCHALVEKRDTLVREARLCLRKGDAAGAIIKNALADCLDDCLDLTRIEIQSAKLTLTISEDALAEAFGKERG